MTTVSIPDYQFVDPDNHPDDLPPHCALCGSELPYWGANCHCDLA